MIVDYEALTFARWKNVVRLAHSLGIKVPKWCNRRRRRVVIRRVIAAIYPPKNNAWLLW